MANKAGGTNTICPYYVREANKSITCEGTVSGTLSQHRFDSEQEMLQFQTQFCCTRTYSRCPHAASLNEKYQNDGNTVILDGNTVIFPRGTIGQRIVKVRKCVGYTQEQLAQRAHLSRSFIGDVEADRCSPSINTLKAISAALQVDATIFITEGTHEK